MRRLLPVLGTLVIVISLSCMGDEPAAPVSTTSSAIQHSTSTAVGTLAAGMSVSAMGSAQYSIPIVVAPGRLGIEPTVSLEYDSSLGTGIGAVGWSLGGLSRIERCEPIYQAEDPYATVRWENDDALCLDGKHLSVLDGGDPGEPGTEYQTKPDVLTRVALKHQDIGGAGSWFEVRTRDGLIYTYGGSPDTNVEGFGGMPAAWWVRFVSDRFGNRMQFVYEFSEIPQTTADITHGYADHHIKTIYYTISTTPALAANRRLDFIYGPRPATEQVDRYDHGAETIITQRLIAIENHVGAQKVRRYELGYKNGTPKASERSTLTAIKECDGANVCKPPTKFEYSTAGVGRYEVDWDTYAFSLDKDSPDAAVSPMPLTVDIDGRRDMLVRTGETFRLFRGTGAATANFEPETLLQPTPPKHGPQFAGDMDGDGRDEIITTSSRRIVVTFARTGGALAYTTQQTLFEFGEEPTAARFTDFAVADFDGDGKDDVMACRMPGLEEECFAAGQDDGDEQDVGACWPEPGDCDPDTGECDLGEDCESAGPPCTHTNAYWHLIGLDSDTETKAMCATDCGPGGCATYASWIVVDHDHDGVDDLLEVGPMRYKPPNDDSAPYSPEIDPMYFAINLEAGDESEAFVETNLPFDVFQRYNTSVWGVGQDKIFDVNGDGHDDVVRMEPVDNDPPPFDSVFDWGPKYYDACSDEGITFHGARARVYLNTGKRFEPHGELFKFDSYADLCDEWRPAAAVDWNGDGRLDLAFPHKTGDESAELWVARSRYPELADVGVEFPTELSVARSPIVPVDVAGTGMGIAYWHGIPGQDAGSWHILYRNATPDLLTRIVDGHGAENTLEYLPLSDPDVYRPGTSSAELRSVCDTRSVVSAVHAPPNGPTTTYSYEDLDVATEHWQLRGFTSRTAVTNVGISWYERTLTRYAKDVAFNGRYPFANRIAEQTTWVPLADTGRHSIQRITNEYSAQVIETELGSPLIDFIATLDVTRTERWENDGSCNPYDGIGCGAPDHLGSPYSMRVHREVERDDFGSPTTIVDSDIKVTTTQTVEYENREDDWLIGLPTSVTTTSESPANTQWRRSEYVYAPVTGAIEEMTDTHSEGPQSLRTVFHYYDNGNVRRIDHEANDVEGDNADVRSSSLVYEDPEQMFPTKIEDGNHRSSTIVWDPAFGEPASITDPNGIAVNVVRDGFSRPTAQTRSSPSAISDGASQTFTYERMDAPLAPETPSRLRLKRRTAGGNDETLEHDIYNREVKRLWRGLNGEQRFQTFTFDSRGRMTQQSLPTVVGQLPEAYDVYAYDEIGRLLSDTRAAGGTTKFRYISGSLFVTDPRGNAWRHDYDSAGRPRRVVDPNGTTVCYYTGAFGQPVAVGVNLPTCDQEAPAHPPAATKDAYLTRVTVDPYGRTTHLDDPNLGPREYAYDPFGNLVTSTDAAGAVTTYEWDPLGRMKRRIDDAGETTFTWDDAEAGGKYGFLRETTSPSGIVHTYSYDDFARLVDHTAVVDGDSFTTTFGYDAFSRGNLTTYPPGPGATTFGIKTTFDLYGNATRLAEATTNQEYWRLVSTTPGEQLRDEKFGNGLVSKRTYVKGRLTNIATGTNAAPQSIQHVGLVYDDSGNLKERNDLRALQYEIFSYDNVDRLWKVDAKKRIGAALVNIGTWSISYNGLGVILSKSGVGGYTYGDPAHPMAVTSAGGVTAAYDDNGNVIERGDLDIHYTPFLYPDRVEGPDVTEEVLYDAGQNAVLRRETYVGGERTTIDLDGFRRVIEVDGFLATTTVEYNVTAGGRPVARVLRKPGLGGVVTTTHYVHDDHVGSPEVVTTSGGAVAERMSWDAWGKPRNPDFSVAGEFADPLEWSVGFAAGDSHRTEGLTWMGARLYDAALGRFLAPDPFSVAPHSTQGHDRYSYVYNRPLNLVDPTGLHPWPPPREEPPPDVEPEPEPTIYWPQGGRLEYDAGFSDEPIELEPYTQSTGEMISSVAFGFVDATADQIRSKGTGIALSYAASNPMLWWALPAIFGYGVYESVGFYKGIADDPIGALYDMTSIPQVLSTVEAFERGDYYAGVREGLNLAVGFVEGLVGGKAMGPKCFAAGTLVHTDGGLVPIEKLAPGDQVLAMDPETGESGYRAVTRVFVTEDQPLLSLRLEAATGATEQLQVTAEHPFWTSDGWVSAGELRPGERVLSLASGWMRVSSGTWVASDTVYNIEVEDLHTYFVGTAGVLAHNTCPRKPVKHVTKKVQHADDSISYTVKGWTVRYTADGYPDFTPHRYKGGAHDVTITMSGSRRLDDFNANNKAGLSSTPKGYTWHHTQEVLPDGSGYQVKMQLVDNRIHDVFPHSGGVAIYRELTGTKYKRRRRRRRCRRLHGWRRCHGAGVSTQSRLMVM